MTITKGAVGSFNGVNTVQSLRNKLKYKVNTTSTTAKGIVHIGGATNYPREPAVYFTREAWVKQCHLVDKCPKEVGWFAMVDHDPEDNSFTITELVIPKQEVSAAETNIGKDDLADAALELMEQGKDTSKLYAWFHSHVNMGVSPSGQDEYQVENYLEDLVDEPAVPAFIRGIQNKRGDLKIDVYFIHHGIAYQNIEAQVLYDDDPQWYKDVEEEIKTKIREQKFYPGLYNGGTNNTQKNTGLAGFQNEYGQGNANNKSLYGGYNGYNAYENTYGYYDDDEEDDAFAQTIIPLGYQEELEDVPDAPTPVDVPIDVYNRMELVYQSRDNEEVLLDDEGKLWICDEKGLMYDYQDYTAAYGEIGGTYGV